MSTSKDQELFQPIIAQLYEDIYNGFDRAYVKKGIKDPLVLKQRVDLLLSNSATRDIGGKFLDNAYKRSTDKDIMSGELLIIHILESYLGALFEAKSSVEKIQYGKELVKGAFFTIGKSTVALYAISIIKRQNGDAVLTYITKEVLNYFSDIKKGYINTYGEEALKSNYYNRARIEGGDIDKSESSEEPKYKRKYKEKKKEFNELTIRCKLAEEKLKLHEHYRSANAFT